MISEWISSSVFGLVHRNNLVYNCCWEDPRLDRAALQLSASDSVVMITSAGCNALDYALAGPKVIHAVDMNYRQNALLELKMAGIRRLDFEQFFALFGSGRSVEFPNLYKLHLRDQLSSQARVYWDKRASFFSSERGNHSFYFRGTSGSVARVVKAYVDRKPRLREALDALFEADSVDSQSEIYEYMRPQFWTKLVRWIVGRDSTMAMLGVPRAQRLHVERHYPGGISKFVEDCIESVFARLPLFDNYFWRLYVYGRYTPQCCPEYLKEGNFQELKDGKVDLIQTHTATIGSFLEKHPQPISRFVLLDHMDWMHTPSRQSLLAAEWQAIVNRASQESRLIWRSGGLDGRFVDSVRVTAAGVKRRVGELLTYHTEHAAELHARDRVHTYGSFCIADLSLN